MVKRIFDKKFFIQLIKFNAISWVNFIIDQGVFILVNSAFRVAPVVSKVVSYSCALVNSFFMNKKWTFQKDFKFFSNAFLKFVLVNVCSLSAASLAVYLFTSKLGIAPWITNILSTVFSFTINFTGNKYFVFREKKEGERC